MVAEFHATLTFIGHVAIGTRDASLPVNTHLGNFIIGMLRFQYRRAAQFMNIIVEAFIIIISLHIFHRKALIPRESQILAIPLEIIFHMALRTYQRTHLLRSSFRDVPSLACESLDQSRTADMQIHILRFVAIGASDRIHYFRTHSAPLIIIESIHTNGFHHAGNIRTLARPTSRRLRAVFRRGRRTRTEACRDIFNRMHVSARSGIIFRESISRPQNHHFGTLLQHINGDVSVELALEISLCRLRPGLIFTGEVILKDFITGFDACNDGLAVIEHACQFRPSLCQCGNT